MARNLALLVTLVLAVLGFTLYYAGMPPATAPVPQPDKTVYQPVPDFAFTDLAGRQHQLSTYRGKVILLNFWASWCVPCRVEFPQFINLAKARSRDIVIVALSVDHDRAAMDRFLAEMPELASLPNFFIVHDREKTITQDLFQIIRFPETILVGPDLTMRRKYLGIELAWDGTEFDAEITRLLTKP